VALTADRNTRRRTGDQVEDPVAGGETIYAGALVALDSNGRAVAGKTATGLTARGRAEAFVDNAGGANGDKDVPVRRGVFRWANDATDTIDRTHIGSDAYIVDDETVASNDGAGTRSVAGPIVDVDDDGVWVETG
jgi:hypothetical protein